MACRRRGRNAPSARCWTDTPRASTSWRTCTPRALSIRTVAPTPNRLETVPRRSMITRWPVSQSLRSTRDAALVVGVDEIEIAVAAQVAEGRAETDALLVEAPGRADVLELQVAQVAKGQMGLGQHGAVVHDPDPLGRGFGRHHARAISRRCGLPVHAVGHEEIEAAVVVQVFEARRPRPVRGGDAGQESRLEAAARAGVQEERAAVVLRRRGGVVRRVSWSGRARRPSCAGPFRGWSRPCRRPGSRSSPSLFTSPRSEPIEENGVCGTTWSMTLVNVPSRLLW